MQIQDEVVQLAGGINVGAARASGASELRCVPRAWCPDHDVTEAGTAAACHGGGA